MRKSKLLLSLAMMCLSVAVLCFGVLAAQSVNYTISGTISYEVNDAFVEMKTSVWYTEQYLKGQSYDVFQAFSENLPSDSSVTNNYGFVQDTSVTYPTYNSLTGYTEGGYATDGMNISLGTNKTAMIIVEVTNLGEKDTWVVAYDENIGEWLTSYMWHNVGYQEQIVKGATKNLVIVMAPNYLTESVSDEDYTFNFPLVCGIGDYVEWEIEKGFFEVTDGTTKVSLNLDNTNYDPKSLFKIPSTYNGKPVTEISGDSIIYAYNLIISENVEKITAFIGDDFSFTKNVELPSTLGDYDLNLDMTLTIERIHVNNSSNGEKTRYYSENDNVLYKRLGDNFDEGIELYFYASVITESDVTISSKVVAIHKSAFYGNENLRKVSIPNSVKTIGESAFNSCTSLTSITISSNITSMGRGVFNNCKSLTSVVIQEGVEYISEGMFSRCTSLTSITIPSSVTSIGSSAFSDCTSLASIEIPGSVTSIKESTFGNCKNLTSITIPSSVTSIGSSAFSGCTSLISITIPSGVTNIGSYAFNSCTSLTSITIPSNVDFIGPNAFMSCTNLTSVTFEDPNNWFVTNDQTATSGTNLTLTNPATNATYLKSTYLWRYWKKSA